MAKNTSKGKGKAPIHPLQGADGRFLPVLPNPPRLRPPRVLGTPTQPGDGGDGTPIHPGGLRMQDSSSSDQFYTKRLRTRADMVPKDSHDKIALAPLPQASQSALQRVPSVNLPTTEPHHAQGAPVTVETVTDKDVAAMQRSCNWPVITETGGSFRAGTNHSPSNDTSNLHESPCPVSHRPQNRNPNPGEIISAGSSMGATRVEQLLNEESRSQGHRGSRFSHNSGSIEQVLREHADRAEEHTQTALDLNRRVMELLMQSLESTQEARTEAVQAREHFEDLLSVSSHHHECARTRHSAEMESVEHVARDARDWHCKQADFERRLSSNVLTNEERMELKPPPLSSWRFDSGLFPKSTSRHVQAAAGSQELGASMSMPMQTLPRSPASCNPSRMSVHDWVRYNAVHPPPLPEVVNPQCTDLRDECRDRDAFMHNERPGTQGIRIIPTQCDISQPMFQRDHPPHLLGGLHHGAAGGAGGGPNDPRSSSSPSTEIPRHQRGETPWPRCRQRPSSGSDSSMRSGSPFPPTHGNIPKYMNSQQSCMFEPLAPGACIYNDKPDRACRRGRSRSASPLFRARTPPVRCAVPRVPPPMAAARTLASIGSCGGPNARLRADHGDKVTNMLRSSFIDEATAAGRRGHTIPVHKLGIKTGLPKGYKGDPDLTVFKNWLSLLLGFFRIHQLDVLNEGQDRTHLEILGQALKEKAHTYFRERMGQFLERGETWDFREAILDLRDRYLYKSTPFTAAQKFNTIKQGNRDMQALYDDLTMQAARMIEYPSDYQFRLRFMLVLRPEILEYIIKTHCISVESSTIAEIRMAVMTSSDHRNMGSSWQPSRAVITRPSPYIRSHLSRALPSSINHIVNTPPTLPTRPRMSKMDRRRLGM
jgi:hypothetical protein